MPRKQGQPLTNFPGYYADDAIGRVFTVHPNKTEAFYLRLLLHNIRGPTSFEGLRTYKELDENNNIIREKLCSTFQEACFEHGLLEDDTHWNKAMQEAALLQSPAQIRY